MDNVEVFGAFASIRIRFTGDIRELAAELSRVFNLSKIDVEPSEFPPYEDIGSFEVLGWEGWLSAETNKSGWFGLRIETAHASDEILRGRLHDLSSWLARYVSTLCELETKTATRIPD